jgi:hypothetical protein
VHPLRGDEIRALRELQRQYLESKHVFSTERDGPFTLDAVNRLIKRIGERAGFGTCSGIAAVTHWRMPETTLGPFRTGSGTAAFSTLSGTPNLHRRGLRTSGETKDGLDRPILRSVAAAGSVARIGAKFQIHFRPSDRVWLGLSGQHCRWSTLEDIPHGNQRSGGASD